MPKPDKYKVTVQTARTVQSALRAEQARRVIKGEKVRIEEIASEWLTAKAAEYPVG